MQRCWSTSYHVQWLAPTPPSTQSSYSWTAGHFPGTCLRRLTFHSRCLRAPALTWNQCPRGSCSLTFDFRSKSVSWWSWTSSSGEVPPCRWCWLLIFVCWRTAASQALLGILVPPWLVRLEALLSKPGLLRPLALETLGPLLEWCLVLVTWFLLC